MLETLILSVCSFGSSVFAANASRCDTVVPFVKRLVITCIECQTFKSDFSFSFFFLFFLGGGVIWGDLKACSQVNSFQFASLGM